MLSRCAAALVVLVAACEADVGTTPDGPSVDAAPGPGPGGQADHVRYRGTLAASPTVQFGGDPYCTYSVTLRNVVLDVVVRGTEELTSMSIDDTMTEAIVGSCPYAPSPQSRQQFAHDSGRPVPANAEGTFTPLLTGVAANRPMTAATALVTIVDDARLQVTARWERTDQAPPLKWIVATAAPVTVQAVTCERGALVCVGGSQGLLYSCEDGMHMAPVRLCAAGCASSGAACN